MKGIPVLAAVGIALTPVWARAEAPAIVLVPCGDVSGRSGASPTIAGLMKTALEKKGWNVRGGEGLERLFEERRVRYLDSLTSEVRSAALAPTHADAVMFSTVYSYLDAKTPAIALSARLEDREGRLVWGDVVALTGADTQGMLELGRTSSRDALASKAVETLLRSMPKAGARFESAPFRSSAKSGSGVPTYVSRSIADGTSQRICVLPLENLSGSSVSAFVLGEILAFRLGTSGRFDVVEFADVRQALVAAKIRGLRGLDPATLQALGKALHTGLFLGGTIYRYRDVATGSGEGDPEIEIRLTLTDVAAKRVAWTSAVARRGSDYSGLLRLGSISNAVALADRVVGEMIHSEEKAARKGEHSK